VLGSYINSGPLDLKYFAMATRNRLVAFMGESKFNPLLISKESPSLPVETSIERKESISDVDGLVAKFTDINELVAYINIDEPIVYLELSDSTLDSLKEHYVDMSVLLNDFISGYSNESQVSLDKSKMQLLGSCRAFFLLDLKKKSLVLKLERLESLRTNANETLLVSKGRLYGHYVINPATIVQSNGFHVADDVDTNEYPSMCFELDFLDLYIMLKNKLNVIGITRSDKNSPRIGTDSLQINDYISFYSDIDQKDCLDFYCLVLPSYLK
jgi:hypothetical protein